MKYTERNTGSNIILLCIMALFLMIFKSAGDASADLTMTANHDHIKVDFFYHGSTVSVKGETDPDVDLIVKIQAPDGHQALRKKGKAAGFLWMNTGELNFEHVPNLYFLHSSKKLDEIIDPVETEKYGIGYPALRDGAVISPTVNEAEKARWFDEFIKYKETVKLYDTSYGQIKTEVQGEKKSYYILCTWPYQAPPGTYTVTVYAVKGGKVLDTAHADVLVEQVGVVKTLFDMAMHKGSTYGIISILAALGAGFGVGMVFKKDGGAH